MISSRKTDLWPGTGVFALAAIVLAWSAYDAASRLLPSPGQPASQTQGPRTVASTPAPPAHDISRIINAHLFGQARQPGAEQTVQAPETKLQLKLTGVVASEDQHLARAIVGVNESKVRAYSLGQTIQGTDAAVHKVESQRVLLKRGSALESLALKRKRADISRSD